MFRKALANLCQTAKRLTFAKVSSVKIEKRRVVCPSFFVLTFLFFCVDFCQPVAFCFAFSDILLPLLLFVFRFDLSILFGQIVGLTFSLLSLFFKCFLFSLRKKSFFHLNIGVLLVSIVHDKSVRISPAQ